MSTPSKHVSLPGILLGLCVIIGAASCRADERVIGVVSSYELITEQRPDSAVEYNSDTRVLYRDCAANAKKMKIAVHPYPAFASDFFVIRETHLRDGDSIYKRSVGNAIDHDAIVPASGCAIKTYQSVEVSIQHKGLWQFYFNDEKPQVPPERGSVRPPDPTQFAMYVLPKNVNGIALKCTAPGSPRDRQVEQECIVDPAVVIVAHPNGSPVDAHSNTLGIRNTTLRLRPVSLKVGIKIDPAIFIRK
jgi:hypothetical protein